MSNVTTMLFVGIALFAVLSIAPIAAPVISNIADTVNFAPSRY